MPEVRAGVFSEMGNGDQSIYNAQASFRKEFCVLWPRGRGIATMAQPGLLVLWGSWDLREKS